MKIQITLAGHIYEVDPTSAHNLSISLHFQANETRENAAQPNAFGLPRAHAAAARAGDFVGDTRQGGSANCVDIRLNPHANGTHTECVGHLVDEAVAVGELATQALMPALILSVPTERLGDTAESYGGAHEPDDRVLTKAALQAALRSASQDIAAAFCQAIILRTLPNTPDKKTRQYSSTNPAYPTTEAVAWLGEVGCEHLVLDLPSLDREVDKNQLPNHHLFFDLSSGAHSLEGAEPSSKTITEMAFIPNTLADGPGFLSLQIPRFALDAAPSRPLFFSIICKRSVGLP